MSNLPENIPPDVMSALGALNEKSRLTVDDLKLMVLLECSGGPFYDALADSVGDEESAALLRQNGKEEIAHAHRMKKAIEILSGEPYEIPSLAENPYGTPMVPSECSPDFLEMLRGIEFNGDATYNVWADNEPNEEVAQLMRQNGKEETRHGERVGQVLDKLRASAST